MWPSLRFGVDDSADSTGSARLAIIGHRGPDCGVARIDVLAADGTVVCSHLFDTYAAHAYDGLLFVSMPLAAGQYVATVTALGETGLWIEKSGCRRGGTDTFVNVHCAELLRV